MKSSDSIKRLYSAQEFGEEQQVGWSSWFSWSSCSRSCDDGTRTRFRACQSLNHNACEGSSVVTEPCNDGPCPMWSRWSSWSECSANCDGGIQSRTRQCQNGEENECEGSSTYEQQCNQQSCEPKMIYWNNSLGHSRGWKLIYDENLPSGETMLDQCTSYCLSFTGCIAVMVVKFEWLAQTEPPIWAPDGVSFKCYITDSDLTQHTPWSNLQPSWSYTGVFAVLQDYYDSNPSLFDSTWHPDGTTGIENESIDGLCDETNTGFGIVNYKLIDGIEFTSYDGKNIIRESGSVNCAVRCFETAGCSAFFVDGDGCTYIIGRALYGNQNGSQNDNVTQSGILSNLCPSTSFKNTFTRRSRFFCLIFAPNQGDALADRIVAENIADSDTPLRAWSFETQSNNPMVTSSQYISVKMPDMWGGDSRYRPIVFTIETHIRIGEDNQSSRKRRSIDRESEFIVVGEITEEIDQKLWEKATKKTNQTVKQLVVTPRTEDIIAEIEAIERQATSYILNGDMEMPSDVRVTATGPIETVEFVQTTNDGSVAADCSSGSCECSTGFVDNGNGCEEMTDEQAETTQPPATTQSVVESISARDWLPLLVDKMESVFEENRPSKPRSHLMEKWTRLSEKFIRRYESVSDNGCDFAGTYEDDSVDFNSISTCRVSFKNILRLVTLSI